MVSSAATPVKEYLDALPEDRRKVISGLRTKIQKALPAGYSEVMQYGMISYVVPLAKFPDTYNGQPLTVVSLASQKQHMAVYLLGLYGDEKLRAWFEKAWAKSGKKLDMGKSCLRFKKIEDLDVGLVEEAVGKVGVGELIAQHEAVHGGKKRKAAR